jgi:tryptophan synthase beta chain
LRSYIVFAITQLTKNRKENNLLSEKKRRISMPKKIPHRLYLTEDQMPKQWYNLRADMKELPDPILNPGTLQPCKVEELYPIFCEKLAQQEMDNTTRYIDIPEEIQDFYKMYRPSPLIRAYNLEKALGTPAKIYYKFEGNNTSGSHKLNSAIAQAYYAKEQGLKGLTTETGAGQWGTALSEACSYYNLPLTVFMVKVSYSRSLSANPLCRPLTLKLSPAPVIQHRLAKLS